MDGVSGECGRSRVGYRFDKGLDFESTVDDELLAGEDEIPDAGVVTDLVE